MFFQPRNKMQVLSNQTNLVSHAPTHNIKNILGLKGLAIRDENSLAAQRATDAKALSKIPVLGGRSRIPVSTANQQENRFEVSKFTQQLKGKATTEVKCQPKPKPTVAVVSAKPVAVIDNIDTDTNCFLLSEYAPDIYVYLREVERQQKIDPNFLTNKNCVAPHMRAILVNWLLQVHQSFNLSAETLYICISMVDRYFATQTVQKTRIQLVGITALFIAAKYEEIYYPELNEFVTVCDSLYTKREIIRMELTLLDALKFELGRPLPLHFLRRGSKAAHADGRTHMLGKYLCELMLIEYEAAHWNPSLTAATALYLSLRLIAIENGQPDTLDNVWSATVEHYTGYSKSDVIKCSALMCKVIVASETSKYQSCRRKYATTKYMEISKIPVLQSKLVKRLALSHSAK